MSDAIAELPAGPPRDRRLRLALRLASMIQVGTLVMVMPDGSSHQIGAGAPAATIVLRHPKAVRRLVTGGSLGLAEAYVDGLWDSPSVVDVMAVAAANEDEWETMLKRRRLRRLLAALRPRRRRRGIVEQYGLGNDFYAAWLDPTMTCSAALFQGRPDDLQHAQLRKIHRLCGTLRLAPGMRLLEIGCGWGALAEIAARDYGCSVVGITLSPGQLAYAQDRIDRAGLSSRVELRLQDFRDVGGTFDRVISVEMLESLGDAHWAEYFEVVRDRLRKNGVAGLQVVTVADRLFDDYRRGADLARRHIVPGAMLPSKQALRRAIIKAGLAWGEEFWFGRDYAETLAQWRAAFHAAWPRIASQDSRRPPDARFQRMWDYHLAYGEAGFRAGWTDVGQILIARN